jgi:DNA-binding transcriptional MerR regulator
VKTFSTADVEKILDIKAYIFRHWQEEIPLVQPRKDGSGRFVYSKKDIEYLLRIKHLVQEKKFTVEGAREQLYAEQENAGNADRYALSAVRAELLEIYLTNREQKKLLKGYE